MKSRITVEAVASAYGRFRILPLCQKFAIVNERWKIACACPQTVLYYAELYPDHKRMPNEGTMSEALIAEDVLGWARWKWGREYAGWFRMFYDHPNRADQPITEREVEGAGDGLAVRFGLMRALEALGIRAPIHVPPST